MRVLATGTTLFFSSLLIQGFARRGAQVTAADHRRISTGKLSKFTSRRITLPSLAREPHAYLDAVLNELRRGSYDLLVPSFEESILFAQHRATIQEWTRVFLTDYSTMLGVHHKPSLYARCDELGIPAPTSAAPRTAADVESAIPHLRFPVILKLPAGNNSHGITYAHDPAELRARFSQLTGEARRWGTEPPLVQNVVDGDPIYTLMFCDRGRKLGEIIYKPLRTFPAKGGTSAHRIAVDHPEIARSTARLAEATAWTGFLGLDFLVDKQTGVPYLIDANPRANPGVSLGYLAGIDWPVFYLDLLAGREPTPAPAKTGVRDRSWLLDFAWLMEDSRFDLGWPSRLWGRLRELVGMRKHLTPWRGILERDFRADLGLWWQIGRALAASQASGETIAYHMLNEVNFPTPPAAPVDAAAPVRIARVETATMAKIGPAVATDASSRKAA